MAISLNLRGIAEYDESNFNSYCSNCEFSSWCNRQNKPFILQSTYDAIQFSRMRKAKMFSFNLNEISYKTYLLSEKIDDLIEQQRIEEMGK